MCCWNERVLQHTCIGHVRKRWREQLRVVSCEQLLRVSVQQHLELHVPDGLLWAQRARVRCMSSREIQESCEWNNRVLQRLSSGHVFELHGCNRRRHVPRVFAGHILVCYGRGLRRVCGRLVLDCFHVCVHGMLGGEEHYGRGPHELCVSGGPVFRKRRVRNLRGRDALGTCRLNGGGDVRGMSDRNVLGPRQRDGVRRVSGWHLPTIRRFHGVHGLPGEFVFC